MRKRGPARVAAEQERPPLYDPAVHVDPDEVVFVEMYCACGTAWRQRDPVSYVEPQVRDWLARHSGGGHGPVSKAAAVTESEARREAAFRMKGRAVDYRPKVHPNLDVTCTADRPWPVFPEPVLTDEDAAPAAVED